LFTAVVSGLSIPFSHCKQQWGDRVTRLGNPHDSAAPGSTDDSIIMFLQHSSMMERCQPRSQQHLFGCLDFI